MDKLSIITVSYNAKSTIEKTLRSALELNWSNKEILIIDGNSTDGTKDVIKQHENEIDYWLSENDAGIYDAMNKGISKATGEWVAFLNCGDTYYKGAADWIGKITSDIDVVYGNDAIVDKNDKIMERKAKSIKRMLYQMVSCHQAFFVRRRLFDEIGRFDISYRIAADYVWLLDSYLKGKRFHYEDILMVNYRAGGMSELEYDVLHKEYMRVCVEKMKDNASISSTAYGDILNFKRKQSCYFYIKRELDKHKDDKIRELIISNEKYVKYGNLALWCMGKYGRSMAEYLDWCGLEVSYYVDGKAKEDKDEYYYISPPERLNAFCGLIIITTADNQFQNQVKEHINNGLCDDCAIITLDELGEMAYKDKINTEMKCLKRNFGG